MKFLISYFCFLLSAFCFQLSAYAQIPTCVNALAASPQGPFPCSVTVSWQDNADNETSYSLQRRLNGGAWAVIGGTLAANTASAIDATLQQSATVDNVYDYRVAAVNSAGATLSSNPATASFTVTKAVITPKPATGITVTFKGATGLMTCPTCTGGDRKVPFAGDEGTLVISSAAEITVDIKY